MKTTKEIIEEYYIDADEQWDNIEEGMQKYAEEYAKAFGEFCFNAHVPGENDIEDVFEMFKESLKK